MTAVRIIPTYALGRADLDAIRRLLDDAFAGEVEETDVQHALGGLHVLVTDGPRLLAHGAAVQRRLLVAGHPLRCGYVEAVAVSPAHQRRGYGATVMQALEDVIRRSYEIGGLGASEAGVPLYAARGWLRWRGRTSVLTPTGVRATPDDDGGVFVLPVGTVPDLDEEITCDWRDGDPW
jgi:aminoglycoside 2'-N-acetyltransferase I